MDPLVSDTLEALAIKKVLAQFGESEMDLRESAILTLLASGLRLAECFARISAWLGFVVYSRLVLDNRLDNHFFERPPPFF